ncbi:hypothetical protein Tco_0673546 [Tanacetum coccineum]
MQYLDLKDGDRGAYKLLGDVIEVLGCLLEVVKSSREERNVGKSNIGDSDNTGDRGKIVGGAIRACGGIGECVEEKVSSTSESDRIIIGWGMMIQALEDMGEDSAAPSASHSTPIISQPSSSKPQKKKSRRKQRKDSGPTEPVTDEAHVSTPSYDPPQSGEDSMQLSELMNLCTSLQEKVLDLEKAKTAQAKEIASLKKRVKQLEKRRKLRTPGLKRLRKIGSTSRVESSNDVSLGDQEDASKQGRKIEDLDADAEVTLVDETQEMNDDNLMFDTGVLEEQEKEVAEKEVSAADPVTTAGEVVTTANVLTTTIDELTQAQTLIEIKAAKPKAVTSAATTTTTTRPKARGVVVQEPSEFKTTSSPL